MPIEPEPTVWVFPPAAKADPDGPVAIGGDLEPGTILAAYREGLFPMPIGRRARIGWWSPDPRGVLLPANLHVSRTLRRSMRHFEIRLDTAFSSVIAGCADPARPHGWITDQIVDAYTRLHHLGWAHSVETWADGELVGGLYGLCIGGFFAGESMFHRRTDASKAAVAGLVEHMGSDPSVLIDVQWRTEHLSSLGVTDMARDDYLARSAAAMQRPTPPGFDGS